MLDNIFGIYFYMDDHLDELNDSDFKKHILKIIKQFENAIKQKWLNPDFGDIEPMDGGKISGIYVETLDRWEKA